eukprot:s3854_g2.t1
MEVFTILSRFEQHLIPEGGKEQYEARQKLTDFILERKQVTEAGCRICPLCIGETPVKLSICLNCWCLLESHGIRPFRMNQPDDNEDEAVSKELDEQIRKAREEIFKATIFDNALMAKILQMFPFYYNQRVVMSPKEYYDKMVKNEIGRVDLDGICPYTGEDDEGELLYPSDEAIREWFDQKASKVKRSDDIMFAGRPFECMKPTIDLLVKIEKMLEFLVEAGFNPVCWKTF